MRAFKAAVLGAGALLAGWTAWGLYSGRSAETVPYETVETLDGVELRRYPATVLVQTTAPDQYTAFRRLFAYISGANEGEETVSMTAPVKTQGGESIPMTAPVRSEAGRTGTEAVQMAFYLPPEYGPETAPKPTDPTVSLVYEPAKTVATRQFSWYAPAWRVRRQERRLRETLDRNGIESIAGSHLLRYNDPWTPPFMRQNEVGIPVEEGL